MLHWLYRGAETHLGESALALRAKTMATTNVVVWRFNATFSIRNIFGLLKKALPIAIQLATLYRLIHPN